MAELVVKKFMTIVPVDHDDDGRPYCPGGCGQVMTEVAPGAFRCPDGLAVEAFLRPVVDALIAAHEGEPG